jgi:hypothetical protein
MHFLEGVAWEELETTSKPLPTAKLIAMRNLSCIPIGSPLETLQYTQYRRLWFVPPLRIFFSRSKATECLSGSSEDVRAAGGPLPDFVFTTSPHKRTKSADPKAIMSSPVKLTLLRTGHPYRRQNTSLSGFPIAARLANCHVAMILGEETKNAE